jgi:hypoxanthine phosphoribosyltransferase
MKLFVGWTDVQKYVNEVAIRYKDANITGVYGLPRGGLVLAVMLSHKMNVPMLVAPTDGCLIVDDIADSGRSLIHYTDNDTQFNKYHITTMYRHPRSVVTPEYFMFTKDDEWIVFPWECD